jgi:hypothetical protein
VPNNILITPGSASIAFSGSAANTIRLQVEQSGSIAFYGNSGSLLGITDSLSGSLMSISDISGLPIFEVFSDDRIVMGTFNKNTLVVTGSRIGIDKANPTADLDISGSVFITGSLSITGSAFVNGDFYKSGNKQFNYGAFYSTISQSGSANVSQSMRYNTTDYSVGVSVSNNSRIVLANVGVYNLQFSAQILADTGADDVWIWLKKNGTNVAATTTRVALANNEEMVTAWNFIISATSPNDYYEIAWQSSGGDAILLTEPASGNYPSVPSILVSVTQIS